MLVIYSLSLCTWQKIRGHQNNPSYEEYLDLVNQAKEAKQQEIIMVEQAQKSSQELIFKEEEKNKLAKELEGLIKATKERRDKILRGLADLKKTSQREAECAAKHAQQFFKEWNELVAREVKFYGEWETKMGKSWLASLRWFQLNCSSQGEKARLANIEKNSLNRLVEQEKLRVNKIINNFEQTSWREVELIKNKVQTTQSKITRENHTWIKEQKAFWSEELECQNKQLEIWTAFKTNIQNHFAELKNLWETKFFDWHWG